MFSDLAESGTVTLQPGSGQKLSHDNEVSRAEIVMLFLMVNYNSFASRDDLVNTLRYILPSDDVVRDMSLCSTTTPLHLMVT